MDNEPSKPVVSVETRMFRKLRDIPRFRQFNGIEQLLALRGIKMPFAGDERLLGIYENFPGQMEQLLLFTNTAVRWSQNGVWHVINYANIAAMEWVPEDKMEATAIKVTLKGSGQESVPVLGGTDCTRDLFSIMTFLQRMKEDYADSR